MKKMKFNRFAARSVTAGFVVAALMAAQGAFACTVDNWSDTFGNLTAGSPADGVERFSGLCAVQTPSGEVSYVQDENPGGIGRIIARFYVLADNTEDAVIYRGFDSSGNELFNVSLAADGQVTLSSDGVSAGPVSGVSGNWNSIEIDWNAADGLVLTVNNEQPASVDFSASSMVDFVRLGNLERPGNLGGAAGTLNFDSYESRRSTAVGRLLLADASNDGQITGGDLSVIAGEILGTALASGQPDCTEDGSVTGADLSCTAAIILGL